MADLDLVLNSGWILGYIAAFVRIGAFVLASPILNKRVPAVGRLSITAGLALFLTVPLGSGLGVAELLAIVLTNIAIGIVLGFFTGMLFYAFVIAGAQMDMASGLSMAQQFDPLTGTRVSVFARLFDQVAIMLFFVMGGHRFLMAGIYASTRIIPLDGQISLDAGLADLLVERVTWTIFAGLQIAMPALAALFLAEIVLGVGSRMLPQANIFMVGLPAKQLIALALSMAVIVAFPNAVQTFIDSFEQMFMDVLNGLRVV